LPPEYWEALLAAPHAGAGPAGKPIAACKLSELVRHVLRVSYARCGRIVEIRAVDATLLYGADAVWNDVGQRLLDNTCQQRTERHEEDCCWPSFD
jgi:hypothetical protein